MNCLKPDKFTNNFLHDHEFLFNKNMIMRQKFDTVVVTFADPYLLFLAGLLSSPAHFSFLPPVFPYSKLSCSLLPCAFFPPTSDAVALLPRRLQEHPHFSVIWINSCPWHSRRSMTWILHAFLALSLLYTVDTHVYVPAFPASSCPFPRTPSPEIPSSFLWIRNILHGFCL